MKRLRAFAVGTSRVIGTWLVRLEDRPFAVVVGAGASTIVVSLALASSAGWNRVGHVVYRAHAWTWLTVCLLAEVIAYLGYILSIRDIARVEEGPEMDIGVSAKTVVAGFGVFAATRGSGGFAVDYWAFRREGAGRRDALGRVLALGFLEYATLSIVALVASVALYIRVDGHAERLAPRCRRCSSSRPSPSRSGLTSPKRVARLSTRRPSHGRLRRTFADSVAGARKCAALLIFSPREHGLGVLGMTHLLGRRHSLPLGGAPARRRPAAHHLGADPRLLRRVRPEPALAAGRRSRRRRGRAHARAGRDGRPLRAGADRVLIYRLFNFWLPIVPALAPDPDGPRAPPAVSAGRAGAHVDRRAPPRHPDANIAAVRQPGLVLGPLLRYTGTTSATVWVETSAPCEVEVLGQRARTFTVGATTTRSSSSTISSRRR